MVFNYLLTQLQALITMVAPKTTIDDEARKARLVKELKASLKQSSVLTPDSEGYAESIRRWSDAMERKAVSVLGQ